ncbi:MAG: hypothetical protein V4726_17860 [Verrucomicrobiota bacterium]
MSPFLFLLIPAAWLYHLHQFHTLTPEQLQVCVLSEQPRIRKPMRFIRSTLLPCLTLYTLIFLHRGSLFSGLSFGWQPPEFLNQTVLFLLLLICVLLPLFHVVWHFRGAFPRNGPPGPGLRRIHLKLGIPCLLPPVLFGWLLMASPPL